MAASAESAPHGVVEIPLTKGLVTRVDAADGPWALRFQWHAAGGVRGGFYARRYVGRQDGKRVYSYMHKELLGIGRETLVDHESGDTLDNQRRNLRVAGHADNARNRRVSARSKSGFKGITAAGSKWRAGIEVNGVAHYLGTHPTPEAAARAYDAAAREHFGSFAQPNFSEEAVDA